MLSDIQKKYKDRYRIQFCDEDFYIRHQNQFKMWKTHFFSLNPVEKLQAWVVALSCLRRSQDWFGGRRKILFLDNTKKYQHPLKLKQLFSNTEVLISSKINPDINLIDFINEYRIKAFPESCSRSLCYIANNRYPLIITESIPSPLELLDIQISGKRVISINENYETWPNTLYVKRDFLGFVMHDLIHADHFFCHSDHRNGQLGFLKFVKKIHSSSSLQALLTSDNFKTGFEYIISDMNSHPLHLFQTLKAHLLTEIKNETKAAHIWQNWISCEPGLSPAIYQSLALINTSDFTSAHARHIEAFCIQLALQT